MKRGFLTPKDAERLLQEHISPEIRRLINLRYSVYLSDREIAKRLGRTCQDIRREFHRLAERMAVA